MSYSNKRPVTEVAMSLRINSTMVYLWCKKNTV